MLRSVPHAVPPRPYPRPRPRLRPSGPLRALTALAAAFLTVAVTQAPLPAHAASPKPSVLTSFLPIHALTASIAGDHAEVKNWLPQGVDPHDFQFSPRDLRRLRAASVLVVGGLGLEGWNQTQLRRLADHPGLRVVEASAGLPKESLILDANPHHHDHGSEADHDHDHPVGETSGESPNPHFWLDPILMAHAATNIARALQAADPAHADAYARNAATTVQALHALDRDYRDALRDASTAFITYHDAFPYLARRYGLRLVGVVESGPSDQPSARQLADLGRLARAQEVRVLFMDGDPPRLARQIATDLRIDLASLETLETGAFGPDAYLKGMRRNLEVLKSKLGKPTKPQP